MRSICFPCFPSLRSSLRSRSILPCQGAPDWSNTPRHRHGRQLVLALASLLPLTCQAQSGMIYITGAITEPVCSVRAAPIHLSSGARSLQLDMNCNADQSVQMSIEHRSHQAGTPAGQHTTRPAPMTGLLREGEAVPLALKGRQQRQFNFDLAARPGTEAPSVDVQGELMLVSLSYR